jgi:hypothetical protein
MKVSVSKGTFDEVNGWLGTVKQHHFNNVATCGNIFRLVKHAQPGLGTTQDEFFLRLGHSFTRPSEGGAGAGLHFDKGQHMTVTTDDIDLAALGRSIIAIQNFPAMLP